MGWSADKVDDVTALSCRTQDGGYALLWQRYDNNKMAAICYYGNVMAQQDGGYALLWKRFLHLQQYSHRLNFNLFFYVFFWVIPQRLKFICQC